MRGCPQCGEQCEDRSRFCWSCGAPLEQASGSAREARKVVTVLFCDVVDSTRLGEGHDPEQLGWLMSRYFGEMGAILKRHGGTVGKFIGDAVMGVFGTPVLHEDDAIRAVRAAAEMREALAGLNEEFERSLGVRLEVRIGVNTGQVLVGDATRSDTLATGSAINTAKRLESSAGAGEILIGEETYVLARDAIRAEAVAPLAVKGKEHPLRAYRLLELVPGFRTRAQRFGSAFVGRDRELALVRDTLERAVRKRSCELFTVLGQPGVGKSRLVREAIHEALPRATVLQGTCLPYGEGASFWPVIEIVREATDAAEHEMRAALSALVDGEESAADIVDGVAELVEGAGGRRSEERFWAFRRLLEAIARRRPLVVVFDDIHWGEETFLDLIEHVAELARDAPLVLVCIARPELLELRPGWGAGKPNSASILLDPLTQGESERLIGQLLGSVALPVETRLRLLEAAEGYPLFVEEMIAMLVDDGVDAARVRVPATINLLLASRIDRLPDAERELVERAAVEGRVFHAGAVRELSPPHGRADVDRILERLVQKELIAPERTQLRGEQAYRFRHILIRDAAYETLPKRARAELHERFAQWLEAAATDEPIDELVGYHLEHAFHHRQELRRVEQADRELAARAGRHLASAGSKARMRSDMPAAAKLLARAVALLREDGHVSAEILIELGSVLVQTGDLGGADAAFAEAMQAASARGDARLATWAGLERSYVRLQVDPTYESHRLREVAEAAIPVFEDEGDHVGVATALTRVAEAHWNRCRLAATEQVLEEALVHASRAGDRLEMLEILELLGRAMVIGPRPVDEAIWRCGEILEQAQDEPRLEAWTKSMLAILLAMRGRPDEARELYRHSQQGLAELGLKIMLAGAQMYSGLAEMILGNAQAAEREFRHGYDALEEIGEQSTLSTMAAFMARALLLQGRVDDAEHFTVVSERAAGETDLASQVLWRGARARALAGRGELERAELLAREAVALARSADFLNTHADVLMDLAHTLRLAGRPDADGAVAEALSLYELKGNVVSAGQARELQASWREPSPA